jgi:hypothetical protein
MIFGTQLPMSAPIPSSRSRRLSQKLMCFPFLCRFPRDLSLLLELVLEVAYLRSASKGPCRRRSSACPHPTRVNLGRSVMAVHMQEQRRLGMPQYTCPSFPNRNHGEIPSEIRRSAPAAHDAGQPPISDPRCPEPTPPWLVPQVKPRPLGRSARR